MFFAIFIIRSLTKSIAVTRVIKVSNYCFNSVFFLVIHVLFMRAGAVTMKQEQHVKQADWIIAEVYCVY